jgi:hypothetical protein
VRFSESKKKPLMVPSVFAKSSCDTCAATIV